jgi:hypothetical protein
MNQSEGCLPGRAKLSKDEVRALERRELRMKRLRASQSLLDDFANFVRATRPALGRAGRPGVGRYPEGSELRIHCIGDSAAVDVFYDRQGRLWIESWNEDLNKPVDGLKFDPEGVRWIIDESFSVSTKVKDAVTPSEFLWEAVKAHWRSQKAKEQRVERKRRERLEASEKFVPPLRARSAFARDKPSSDESQTNRPLHAPSGAPQ